ncbi:hypothetical protein B296_00018119 [Ensete ventricosum]|uniref:Uncharacterized protein n=1 Tax=Ensete ventricosum TaxID=4639 RepID=A0A427B3H6_ENSVE|nr:hypothetical protein B296_00018119 [Ensete ventricosum]
MTMNLKEVDCYVVNHGEGLMAVDFNDHISLAEKESAGMIGRGENCSKVKRVGAGREWLWRQMGRWQQLGAAVVVEDTAGSDERLMEEKAAGSRATTGEEEEATGRTPFFDCKRSRRRWTDRGEEMTTTARAIKEEEGSDDKQSSRRAERGVARYDCGGLAGSRGRGVEGSSNRERAHCDRRGGE